MEIKKDKEILDHSLVVRMTKTDFDNFKKKSDDLGKPYPSLVREFVKAFNEDRMRIIPTNEQKESLKLYKGK